MDISATLKIFEVAVKGENAVQQSTKEDVSITATKEEWKAIDKLITSYKQQCKAMHHHSPTSDLLDSFRHRLTHLSNHKEASKQ